MGINCADNTGDMNLAIMTVKGIFIYFENNARVVCERDGRDEGFGDHETSESRASR